MVFKNVIRAMLFVMSFNALAGMIETDNEIKIEFKNSVDSLKMYQALDLPIDFGTLVTGKKHQYKAFFDKNKNFLIYCSEVSKNNVQCLYSINKKILGTDLMFENDESQIHVQMTSVDLAKKLYDSLNVPVMEHGQYLLKFLTDEENTFGISCMNNTSEENNYQCDLRIFK